MSKPMTVLFVAFVAAALVVGWKFGNLGIEQGIYLANIILGWTFWTVAVAFGYAALERAFPRVLCPPRVEDPQPAGTP